MALVSCQSHLNTSENLQFGSGLISCRSHVNGVLEEKLAQQFTYLPQELQNIFQTQVFLFFCPPNSKLFALSVSCARSVLNFLRKAPLLLRKTPLFLQKAPLFLRKSSLFVRNELTTCTEELATCKEELAVYTEELAIFTEEFDFYGTAVYLYGTLRSLYRTFSYLYGRTRFLRITFVFARTEAHILRNKCVPFGPPSEHRTRFARLWV